MNTINILEFRNRRGSLSEIRSLQSSCRLCMIQPLALNTTTECLQIILALLARKQVEATIQSYHRLFTCCPFESSTTCCSISGMHAKLSPYCSRPRYLATLLTWTSFAKQTPCRTLCTASLEHIVVLLCCPTHPHGVHRCCIATRAAS
jgi:hypothetical protein